METWFGHNWFDILSILVAAGSLVFAAITIHEDTETRRIANLISLTVNHRELWSNLFKHPELSRLLDAAAAVNDAPVTVNESLLIGMIIQHLNATHEAINSGLAMKPDSLSEDVRTFFSLPVPKAVWENTKRFQNEDFVAFVESCI